MCLHCRANFDNASLNDVLNSTNKTLACPRASDSLKISQYMFKAQPDEVRKVVSNLQKVGEQARKGYRLFTEYDKSIRGESLATVIKNDRAVTREQRAAAKRRTTLPEVKWQHVFKLINSSPALQSLNADVTDLHAKQIEFYHKVEMDLERLTMNRKERTEEAAVRGARHAESAELQEKLKEKVVKKASMSEENNALKAEKRALRKEQALAKKQREQEAKAEIKLNQAKLRDLGNIP